MYLAALFSNITFYIFSVDISRAIDCFINNCDGSEFLLYSNEIDDLMLPDGFYSSSVSELKWVYYSYMCGMHLYYLTLALKCQCCILFFSSILS